MSGIYVIIAELTQTTDIQIGKRIKEHFEKGFYGYVGSALNGLEKRLARHFGSRKRLHWHIDYLLNVAKVHAAVYSETRQEKECLIAKALLKKLASKLEFGCSDCHCLSHLFFHQDFEYLNESVIDSFKSLNLNPIKIKDIADLIPSRE